MKRIITYIVGGAAIVLAFFFGSLVVLDYMDRRAIDSVRMEHARLLKSALEGYRAAHGQFPVLPDNSIDDLKSAVVDGGYLAAIPNDPSRKSKGWQYRYASDGKAFGLLINLDAGGFFTTAPCVTGVGIAGRGFWGVPPCAF